MPTVGDIALTLAPYVATFIITFLGFIIFRYSKQRKLLEFLGADKDNRQTIVYLSSLLIPRGCAVGFDGLPRTYQGLTIPSEELRISARLSKALIIDPFEYIPPVLRKALQEKFAFFRPLTVMIAASPMQEQDIDFSSSIITVGSQGYNIVTDYFVSHNLCQLQISHNGTAIQINKGKDKGEVIRPVSNQHDIAILERLIVHAGNNKATVIVGAGLGVLGTMGAIQYLIDHWQELYKTPNNEEFGLVLQFGPVDGRSFEDLLRGTVIRHIPD
jgi:hypothetical protein